MSETKEETYYLYHIFGKKIGVTRNINKRVTEMQGYAPDEYEVLLTSKDIDLISRMEIELQKSYGYRVDKQLYKNFKKLDRMNINATEQTSTFPCPLNKLKGQLMDNLDYTWTTTYGKFHLEARMIPWIVANAEISLYNADRTYIYNKAFYEAFFNPAHEGEVPGYDSFLANGNGSAKIYGLNTFEASELNYFPLIRAWAEERGIYAKGDSYTQYIKLMEEVGELAQAILKQDETEIIDAIGDMVVVLTNFAKLRGHDIEDCIKSAYNVIKSRQGKMVNGTFIKQTL